MEVGDLSLYCHHQNDPCIKMGSYESHFNISLSHKTVSTDYSFFEGKGDPNRNRAETLLLTSLTPYR